MNYFGIDDVVMGSINSSLIACWPVFANRSYYGSVFGINGPIQQIVIPESNDGWVNVAVKNKFDRDVNLFSNSAVAAGRKLYGEDGIVLQLSETEGFNSYLTSGEYATANIFQSGIQLRDEGLWFAKD